MEGQCNVWKTRAAPTPPRRKLRREKWVVYAKGSFEASRNAYHYLSRYTHRVAIANHRLVNLAEGKVSFQARDNSRPGHPRLVTITAPERIRRFLLRFFPAVCQEPSLRPHGPLQRKNQLEKARALISLQAPLTNDKPKDEELDTSKETKTWQEMLQALTGLELTTCPNCGQGKLIRRRLIGIKLLPWHPAYGILHELRLLSKPLSFNYSVPGEAR